MIKFRQKEFIAPLLAAAGKAAMSMAPDLLNAGASAIQNDQQNKVQQETLENQKKQQDQQNKLLNKIAKKDPSAAASVMIQQNQLQQQQFSKVGTYLKGLKNKYKDEAKKSFNDIQKGLHGIKKEDFKGFATDIGHVLNKRKEGIALGVMAAGAGIVGDYLGNKAVKLYKDYKGKKREDLEEREYSVSKGIKRGIRFIGRVAKKNAGKLLFTGASSAALAAAPIILQEGMKRSMANDTEEDEEREFSVKGRLLRRAVKTRQSLRDIKSDPLKNLIKFRAGTNQNKLDSIANDLSEGGSGSRITKLVSDTVKNHPKTSLLVGGIVAGGIAKVGKKAKEKVYKGIKRIDKNAFSQESKYDNLEE